MAALHSIRIPKVEDRGCAVVLFLDVPATRLILPGHDMVVTDEPIAALTRAGIPFEVLAPPTAMAPPKCRFNSEALSRFAVPGLKPESPVVISPANDSLFTSGTLGRYSRTLKSVIESHEVKPAEVAAD